jgi:hypothetical protein
MTDTLQALTVYGFYDGDFTFWVSEYADGTNNGVWRLRADRQTPEERHAENVLNPNQSRPNPKSFRPATWEEIQYWLKVMPAYPRRAPHHTGCLRHLRLHGPQQLEGDMLQAAAELAQPILFVRDFEPLTRPLVNLRPDQCWELTKDGEWLTSLMK